MGDDERLSLLELAASHGDAETVGQLIASGSEITPTAVSWAAGTGDRDTLAAMLDAGAPVESTDRYGLTPLAFAVSAGHTGIIDFVREPDETDLSAAIWGSHPLEPGHVRSARLLLERGADLDFRITAPGHESAGITPLILAAALGHAPMVSLLLNGGANPTLEDAAGRRARDWASFYRHVQVVSLLPLSYSTS